MSKGLEDLERIKESFGCDPAYYGLNLSFETVKKELTAFEIVKKHIDVDNLKGLTDEQRKLLKEVL